MTLTRPVNPGPNIVSTSNLVLDFAYYVNVMNFGADPTGATDSTAAMQNAHNTGALVYYPRGVYKCGDSINIPGGGIVGDGAYQTYINTTSLNNNNIFNYTGALAGRFENFQLQTNTGFGQKSGGYGIAVGPATGEVSGMRYWQIVISNLPNGINSFRASLWSMGNCNFYNFTGNALNIDNQNNGDSGDSAIQGCVFQSPLSPSSAIAIQQVSSGGIKIVDNKFNNLLIGYLLNLGPVVGGVSTSDLVINGNSFEGSANAGIQLQRASGTATFQNINIGDNQFLVTGTTGAGIYTNDSSGFLSVINITGNVFVVTGSAATGILINYVTNWFIGDCTMQGSGGTAVGILAGNNNVGGRIGVNQISGFQFAVNANSAGVAVTKADVQTGTVVITTSTSYTPLFAGAATVTFPTAYEADVPLNVNDCQVSVANTSNGGVSAYVTNISNTQVAIEAIGITNGGTVTVNWRVAGVI